MIILEELKCLAEITLSEDFEEAEGNAEVDVEGVGERVFVPEVQGVRAGKENSAMTRLSFCSKNALSYAAERVGSILAVSVGVTG